MDDIQISLNSLAGEMENLKSVEQAVANGTGINFICNDEKIARFLASLGTDLMLEYNHKVIAWVSLLPDWHQYILQFQMFESVDMNRVIMSMVSNIDASACDFPQYYTHHGDEPSLGNN